MRLMRIFKGPKRGIKGLLKGYRHRRGYRDLCMMMKMTVVMGILLFV